MKYEIKAQSSSKSPASIHIKSNVVKFGISTESEEDLANPAELFLGSLSSCILKNVERFSTFMHSEYTAAEVTIRADRMEKPPRIENIHYELEIFTNESNLNLALLKKNIEKFGTIYNTVRTSCKITGKIKRRDHDFIRV